MSEEKQTPEQAAEVEAQEEAVQAETEEVKHDEQSAFQEKIDELQQLLDEKENKILRVQADFENYKRRARTEVETVQKYRSQHVVSDLLPALDNFERALGIDPDNEQTKSLLEGMQMVYRQLVEALKNEGVEPIEAVGKEFDPNLHQAVMQVEDENYDSNIVVEELQKGYKLKDRVIRPSMVKVNQ
ncbi:nucleotide exchange factor GrpE [Bacillus altitudinis MN12]|jgi:molecular chaperone GrpE|uniref:Protein GrpE n=4 Tax=Bacillus TaxID=1386 RepID=A0ABV1S3L5_BACAB|nr:MULTISPECIES: nucleotide exchange factor GrpE [Bacillus]AHL72139.1 heat shock protein GrpE [Bacillus pumilus]KML18317.1 heat shock protein GrpE [Bacillus stratosphericus]KQL38318.1 molecular chaperone GrpE [Bacillus sp. FJAT-21955]MBW3700506.1 nucleotide exchange factor GrpE [Bacillus aerophilus]MDG3043327.1 nucleotide exchange factor GrpE [Bacillus sp. B6(2022)]MDH8711061.1 molecular chaperone GrpE [Micromonospora sp. 1209]CVM18971.1 heat shock protein GrpE [Streptococcus pneumoniae]